MLGTSLTVAGRIIGSVLGGPSGRMARDLVPTDRGRGRPRGAASPRNQSSCRYRTLRIYIGSTSDHRRRRLIVLPMVGALITLIAISFVARGNDPIENQTKYPD